LGVIQVGKGLLKDDKAQKLALQHWLEAVSVGRSVKVLQLQTLIESDQPGSY
jgi:hypothetical protein